MDKINITSMVIGAVISAMVTTSFHWLIGLVKASSTQAAISNVRKTVAKNSTIVWMGLGLLFCIACLVWNIRQQPPLTVGQVLGIVTSYVGTLFFLAAFFFELTLLRYAKRNSSRDNRTTRG